MLGRFMNSVVAVSLDRKSTRLNSSHLRISYAVFCLKKKKKKKRKKKRTTYRNGRTGSTLRTAHHTSAASAMLILARPTWNYVSFLFCVFFFKERGPPRNPPFSPTPPFPD